jgi:hypothetical protein
MEPPPRPVWRWSNQPPWPRWWSGHLQKAKKKKKKKKDFGLLGVAEPPPRAWSGFNHPHTSRIGWPGPWRSGPATPKSPKSFFFFFWPFRGGRTTHLAMGVVRPPPDRPWGWLQPPLIFFFLSFFFFFLK